MGSASRICRAAPRHLYPPRGCFIIAARQSDDFPPTNRPTKHLLARTGLSIDDIDLFEINEAFASVVLAWAKEVGADLDKTNVNGGAIALGHPLGSTGTKLMTTLLHELERTGGRYGMQTMCEGGGQANVTIIERL